MRRALALKLAHRMVGAALWSGCTYQMLVSLNGNIKDYPIAHIHRPNKRRSTKYNRYMNPAITMIATEMTAKAFPALFNMRSLNAKVSSAKSDREPLRHQ